MEAVDPLNGTSKYIPKPTHKEIREAIDATSGMQESHPETTRKIEETKTKPLNILILYPDDWRHDTIGKENSIVQTPFLDSLADRGIRFRQNAVTCSICWVSRATLFTGQWPSRHQSKKLICPHFAAGYLWKETAWPGILQKHGYYIGHVVRIAKAWCTSPAQPSRAAVGIVMKHITMLYST
jgi:hypothetical protein